VPTESSHKPRHLIRVQRRCQKLREATAARINHYLFGMCARKRSRMLLLPAATGQANSKTPASGYSPLPEFARIYQHYLQVAQVIISGNRSRKGGECSWRLGPTVTALARYTLTRLSQNRRVTNYGTCPSQLYRLHWTSSGTIFAGEVQRERQHM
jgi:hypothetical protein